MGSMKGWRPWDFFPIVSPYPVCYNQGERKGGGRAGHHLLVAWALKTRSLPAFSTRFVV